MAPGGVTGISIILFAGILSRAPTMVSTMIAGVSNWADGLTGSSVMTLHPAFVPLIIIGMLALVLFALLFRMLGVCFSLIGTSLNRDERLFCMMAYTPKATVQAAIGTIPMTMGLQCGELVLTAAVVSILLTAPFGAICIDKFHKKLLIREEKGI